MTPPGPAANGSGLAAGGQGRPVIVAELLETLEGEVLAAVAILDGAGREPFGADREGEVLIFAARLSGGPGGAGGPRRNWTCRPEDGQANRRGGARPPRKWYPPRGDRRQHEALPGPRLRSVVRPAVLAPVQQSGGHYGRRERSLPPWWPE